MVYRKCHIGVALYFARGFCVAAVVAGAAFCALNDYFNVLRAFISFIVHFIVLRAHVRYHFTLSSSTYIHIFYNPSFYAWYAVVLRRNQIFVQRIGSRLYSTISAEGKSGS